MERAGLSIIDWVVLMGYLLCMVGLGLRQTRRQGTSRHYFLGSGRLPGWVVGMSMFATVISSWAFLALPAKAFQSDLQSLMTIALLPVAAWICVRWFVPLFRERIRLSAYEYLERRFGLGARLYGNLAFLIVHFGKMAGILYLLCLAMAEITGANIYVLIAIVGCSTILYTFFGGMEGVVWTDVVQGFLLLFSGVVAAVFLMTDAPGGPGAVLETAWAGGKFKLVSGGFAWDSASTILFVIFGLTFYSQKYLSDQTMVQRYLLASDTAKAGRGVWVSSLLVMLVWALFMGIGVLLWAYYRLQPELLPAGLLERPDKVFPHFMAHAMPSGIKGLILSGLMAATMSTLSSDLNSLSAVVFDDYYRRLRPELDDRAHLVFSRLVVLGAGLLGLLLAMAMTRIHSMADAAFDFVSLVGGGVMGMYLLGMVTAASARALYIGLGCGVLFILWTFFSGSAALEAAGIPRSPFHTLWVGTIGNLVVFGVGWLAGRILGPAPATEAA